MLASFGQPERDHLGTLGKRDGRMSQDLSLPIIVQDHRTRVGRAAMAPSVSKSGSPGPVPTKITRPLAIGAVGVAEVEVRGLRAEDVLTDFSRSVVQLSRLLAAGG